MKTILLLLLCIISLCYCNTKAVHKDENVKEATLSVPDTTFFKAQVQPLLQKNCSPCHFTGGKMYDKMPFDKGETIISHEAGIVKRFKDEKEAALLKQFIQQNKSSSTAH